ncbi:MAG: hypothetical protein ACTHMX_09125 [Thermomicrobiales bacterium]
MKSTISPARATGFRIAILLVMAFAGGAILALFADGGDTIAPPAASAALSPSEQAYVDTIGVRVLAMNEEMQAISGLVSTHSRNVLELNRRGAHVEALAAEMESLRASNPVPERFARLDANVQVATAEALDGIAQARDALKRFDFSGIADLIPSFDEAAASLDDAASELRTVIGQATPAAVRQNPDRSTIR